MISLREAAQGALAARLSPRYLEEHVLLPLDVDETGQLVVATGHPLDPTVTDELARLFGRVVRVVEASPNDIQAALLGARREELSGSGAAGNAADDSGLGDLRALANDAPVVQLVNAMLGDALRIGASDIHLECARDALRVRMRQDGVLHDVATYAREYQAGVISRVKLLAGLDIAERRLPQDGRARIRHAGREVDVRASTLPALHGESIVLRVLDHGSQARDLHALGMPPEVEARVAAIIRRTTGLVLVTGPTGSGKTTTLYSALARINAPGLKIVTVEDPVEYQIAGVTQVPVNRKAGLGFPNALRSILRHDPDVIMVGEMRDRETAEVAVQSALTGHLVLSTLHTNDAPSAVTRLVDMGIEPYLVAATVQAVLAQRLLRILCRNCAELTGAGAAGGPMAARFQGGNPRRAVGCEACAGSGYRGRIGIHELLVPTDALRSRVAAGAPLEELRQLALAGGMTALADSGWRLVREGVTSADEVLRVTNDGESP